MKDKIYKAHSDSGHGWLAVKRKELVELGILEKVSHYSYQRGATVYLEEDADCTLFCLTYEKKFGHLPKQDSGKWCERSPIRSYESFRK